MLASVVVPPGAHRATAGQAPALEHPATWSACTPLIDQVRFWIVPEPAAQVQQFLQSHPSGPMTVDGHGFNSTAGGVTGYMVTDAVSGPHSQTDQLVFAVGVLSADTAAIRADAEVIPPGAICKSGSATTTTGS
jgi:hypothetical protein